MNPDDNQLKKQEFSEQLPTLMVQPQSSLYLLSYQEILSQQMMPRNSCIKEFHLLGDLPQLNMKESSQSFNPYTYQQLPVFSHPSIPFMKQEENKNQVYSSYLLGQQIEKEKEKQQLRNRIIEGTQTLCDVEIILISRYFDIKTQVFCPPNTKYTLKQEAGLSNIEWMKDRMSNRYKKALKESFYDLLDQIEKVGNQYKMNSDSLKFDTKGFDGIERSVHKSVKAEKPFVRFIVEIQDLLAMFLFTKF
ncbi:hypothetical protein pb186bvf_018895 [Paramecium bursaria]